MKYPLLIAIFLLLASAATAQVSKADVNAFMSEQPLKLLDIVKVQQEGAEKLSVRVDDTYSFELREQGFVLKGYNVTLGKRSAYVPFQSLSFIEFQPSASVKGASTLIFHLR